MTRPDPAPPARPPESRPKVILQAHATRSAAALAVLLHARDRNPRDLRKPFGPLIAGVVLAVVIVIGVYIAARLGSLPPRR
jgi:hypothetical protein